MKYITTLALSTIFLTGCTKYVTTQAIHPSESTKTVHIKTLGLDTIQEDSIALSQNLQASLSALSPYFTIVSVRANPQGIVRGAVTSQSVDITPYNVERSECIDSKCKKTRRIVLTCVKKSSSISANIQIVNPLSREILFASDEYASMAQSHCPDDNYPITSDSDHFARLSTQIAQRFSARLAPYTATYRIALMDEPDISYSSVQTQLLDSALEAIQAGRYDKAIPYLQKLNESTNQKSYVALYDLGVVYESIGNLEEARNAYQAADILIPISNEMVDNALSRIEQNIHDHMAASVQLSQ